ncbi:MAG TPA: hypothetical protein VHM26_08755 [Chitinophagaceae bacterium]|nr:hypothetical protein [Chitinophagaceae bacterium]
MLSETYSVITQRRLQGVCYRKIRQRQKRRKIILYCIDVLRALAIGVL